jgi:hypothetical protein
MTRRQTILFLSGVAVAAGLCWAAPPARAEVMFRPFCRRPVCPPCDSPFFGYYPTLWRAWPALGNGCTVLIEPEATTPRAPEKIQEAPHPKPAPKPPEVPAPKPEPGSTKPPAPPSAAVGSPANGGSRAYIILDQPKPASSRGR